MNYHEISALAMSQEWAAKYKEKADAVNRTILAERQAWLDARPETDITLGDFVRQGDKVFRVAHHWGDSIQLTDGRFGSSFYLGRGGLSFSGGLNPGIPVEQFISTNERMEGAVWFFSEDHVQAHNGYHTCAMFRVWTLAAAVLGTC